MANNKIKFLRGTSDEYTAAEKDSDTIYFTTDDGKLYIGDKEVSGESIKALNSHINDNVKHITNTERTNWNAAKTHADSAHAPSNAQANIIETVKVNGTVLTPSSKAVNVTVPTKVSELTDSSDYVKTTDSRLTDARTPKAHNQASNTINAMTGYSKPSSTSAIATSDSLNTAIGKLEKALDSKQTSGSYAAFNHTHDDRYYTETEINTKLNTKLNTSLKGAANGLAELDSSGKVPSAQLPSYVDDVLEYANKASFPATGESGKIYISQDNNKTYRWSGSAYVEISPSLALGETSATAYRGDRGKIAYDHSQTTHAPSNAQANVIETIKVNGTALTPSSKAVNITVPSYSAATTSAAGLMSAADKTKLDAVANTYALKSLYGDTTINVGRLADSTVGAYSTAEGSSTTASGHRSHAEGIRTIASGNVSHAEGDSTTASGDDSHAEGHKTTASGIGSHAEGYNATASGFYSHAEGSNLNSNNSKLLPDRTVTISDVDYTIKGSNAYGINSHAEGTQTFAYGYSSHSEGRNTTASGNCSHAEGYNTTASGTYSHAEGNRITASGDGSHAEGLSTTANGVGSHAEGSNTIASGNESHAGGLSSKSIGLASFAHGHNAITNSDCEIAFGSHNVSNSDTLFSVGDGSSLENRHNAFEITTSGGKLHDKDIATMDDIPTSLPASDVKAWAKASSKPSYTWDEITSKPSTFTPSSHTHNYAGSSSAGGAATTALTCTGNSATSSKLTSSSYTTISIATSDWATNSSGGYVCTKSLSSAMAYTNFNIDVVLSTDQSAAKLQIESWNNVIADGEITQTTSNGSTTAFTFYAFTKKPSVALTVGIQGVS